MNILLLEDDLILNEIIEEHLIEKSHRVTSIYDGKDAQEILYEKSFDLLLLDVNVPNINGFELLKDLRKREIQTAAIFITSLSMIEDIEEGFISGCDDYIKKPFELKELDIRINNISRMLNIKPISDLKISNNIFLDIKNMAIIKDNKKISITQKESEVLQYLIKNSEKIVSIEELSSNIWTYENSPQESTIRTI